MINKYKNTNFRFNLWRFNKRIVLSLVSVLVVALLFLATFVVIPSNFLPCAVAFEIKDSSIDISIENFEINTIDKQVIDEIELLKAITDATGPTVIALTANIDLTSALNIPADKEITLISYGSEEFYQLIGASGKSTIDVFGTIVLFNITVTHNTLYTGSGLTISGGTCIMIGGEISGNKYTNGGGVAITEGGSFSMYGGKILGNTATNQGGGVHNNKGSFSLSANAVIANNTARTGGGVYNIGVNTIFTMSGGIIGGSFSDKNVASSNGGGVYNSDSIMFEMLGGEISYNEAGDSSSGAGGGVYNSNSTFTMTGGKILGNKSSSGGGVYNINGVFNMSEGAISDNTATYGGGVYNYGTFTMSNGIISDNEANYGGGVYNTQAKATFTMSGGKILGNKALLGEPKTSGFGGGVYSELGSTIMSGGLISGNTANFGGGTFNYYGTYVMSNNAIIADNFTPFGYTSGGGVYNYGDFTMLGNSAILNNSATWGGGVFNEDNIFTMQSGTIAGNKATSGAGGGLYNNYLYSKAKIIILGGTISNNTTPASGGGIYVTYGSLNKVTVAAGVIFSGNSAAAMYSRNSTDDAVYNAQIASDVTWTAPARQGYNNFDIGYTNGVKLTIYTVEVHDSYAPITGANSYFAEDFVTVHAGNRVGYTFIGWTTNMGEISLQNDATTSFIMPENNVIITANWKKIEEEIEEETRYTLTYNGNGYTSGAEPIDKNNPYTEGALVIILNQGDMIKTNYVFLGWAQNPTATLATFTAGSTFIINRDTTLYAVWSEITYTVTYQPGTHGTFTTQTTNGLYYDDPTPNAPTTTGETGWIFAGWTPTPTPTVTCNATYIAQWSQIPTPPTVPPTTSPSTPTPTATAISTPTPTLAPTPTTFPSSGDKNDSTQVWALMNLILSITGVVLAILTILYVLLHRKQKNKQQLPKNVEYENVKNQQPTNEHDVKQVYEEKQNQYSYIWLATAFIMSITSIIVFLLTENMNYTMTSVDKWTIINLIILVAEIIAIIFAFKHKKSQQHQKQAKLSNSSALKQ